MATPKPQRSPAEIEDIILRKIFLISLADPSPADPAIVYLEQTAAELLSEDRPLLLLRDSMERVLIDRLSTPQPPLPPFTYLVASFRRAADESRKIASMKDPSVKAQIDSAIRDAKKLLISYARIVAANPDTFPSPNHSSAPPSAEIFSFLLAEVASPMDAFGGSSGSGVTAPPGFLEEFFRNGDYESLDPVFADLYDRLRSSVERISALGDFQRPLRVLLMLIGYPICAKGLVNHPRWIPKLSYLLIGPGRTIEITSILGAFFHVSALPDYKDFRSTPDVGLVCLLTVYAFEFLVSVIVILCCLCIQLFSSIYYLVSLSQVA